MKARALTLAAALALAVLVPLGPGALAAGPGATVAPAVSGFLASEPADARMDVIVTSWDEAGMTRLETLGHPMDRLTSVPMAFVNLSAREIQTVAGWSETRSVWDNTALDLHLDDGTRMVKADQVWAGERLARPYLGTGVGVAVLDTGVDALHPDLPYGTKVKRSFYVGGNPVGSAPEDTVFAESPLTDTEHGHGTHVSSTIAGTGAASGGQYQGVAPGADLYVFKVGAGASVFVWWAARAFDWVIENGEEHNIRVISNSWGGGGGSDYNPDDPINILSKAAYDHDIVTVFSAGNGGGPDKMGRNAVSPYVVSVAAANKDFTKAAFSSTGRPGGNLSRDAVDEDGERIGLHRPTVIAPGVDITAAHSSTGFVMADGVDTDNPMYTSASGTSMSAPHVSGIIALILEARPALSAQNVIDILEGTATSMPDYAAWEVGAGFADAHAAVQAAEKGRVKFPPSTKGKTPAYQLVDGQDWTGTVLPGGYALLELTSEVADEIEVEVGPGVDALYAEIEWATTLENIYLLLYDPDGNEVESSAGLLDIGSVNFRTVATTHPEPGTWTIQVVGRTNAITDYRGFYGLYEQTKPKRAPKNVATTSTDIGGEVSFSVDPVNDVTFHEFEVPEGATEVTAAIAWGDPDHDIDLYIYDATGRQVGSSTDDNIGSTREPSEEATATSSDPLGDGLVAGTWKVEVRGWLVTAPQEYTGEILVTAPTR